MHGKNILTEGLDNFFTYHYCGGFFFIVQLLDDKSEQAEGVAGTTAAELMKYFSSSVYKGFQDNNAVSTHIRCTSVMSF